jgi:hypothetical protein
MKLILNILASDILETDYHDSRDCAITRALARAGYNYHDSGICIVDNDDSDKVIVGLSNNDYQILSERVLGMYATKENADNWTCYSGKVKQLVIEDFEHTINI